MSSAGDGVLILVKDTISASEMLQFKTDCEVFWIKLELVGRKPLFIALTTVKRRAMPSAQRSFRSP